ncbi:hypothetical protein BH11PSE3_BH11PSE3_24420 [soil metagenome]
MRVLIDGKAHEPLSAAEEKDVRQFRAEDSVVGAVLSADEATAARIRQTRRVYIGLWGLTALFATIMASVAGPADQPLVFASAVAVLATLGAYFAFVLGRRRRAWQGELPRRLAGLAPAGTAIHVSSAGVAVAGQIFPWSTLAVDQVEFARLGSRYRTMFTIERLILAAPGAMVVLDPALMQNGHPIIGNVWRRMRLAGPGGTV